MTRLGVAYGAIASLVFPVFFAAMSWSVERIQNMRVSRPLWNVLRFAIPVWLVILPGALVAGVVLAHVVSRGYVRRNLTAGATGLVLTSFNAGVGGAINFLVGNPCGLGGGIATSSLWGGFVGGVFGFLLFCVITFPTGVGTGILLRRAVHALRNRTN